MSRKSSSVHAMQCGASRRLTSSSSPRRWGLGNGSSAKTSTAAPAICPVAKGVVQRVLVDDPAAGGVDEVGARLHQGELAATDQPARPVGQGAVDGHEIGLGQELVEPDEPDPESLGQPGVEIGVERQRGIHAEPGEEADQTSTDPAEPDDAQRVVAKLAPHHMATARPTPPSGPVHPWRGPAATAPASTPSAASATERSVAPTVMNTATSAAVQAATSTPS